eukprot:Rhum_TRINITY_DN10829_c0_g2::Rhum_TRINITY_DN10829_c0_g2_i1::g.40591::m.40591
MPETSVPTQGGPTAQKRPTLEQSLLHALYDANEGQPNVKEFKEAMAFCAKVRSYMMSAKRGGRRGGVRVVVDVAGGHGMLAALFLVLEGARRGGTGGVEQAIVLDPAHCSSGRRRVDAAWGREKYGFVSAPFEAEGGCCGGGGSGEVQGSVAEAAAAPNRLSYINDTIEGALQRVLACFDPHEVLVVSCHACQHLTDDTCRIAAAQRVYGIATMACCHKFPTDTWKRAISEVKADYAATRNAKQTHKKRARLASEAEASDELAAKRHTKKASGGGGGDTDILSIGLVSDLLLAGRMMALTDPDTARSSAGAASQDPSLYDVRLSLIPSTITPQNRLVMCRLRSQQSATADATFRQRASQRLATAYAAAHSNGTLPPPSPTPPSGAA